MSWAWESEKQHVALYTQAKRAADAGKDVDFGTVYVCEVCGHTVVGTAPDRCPICNMARDRFRAFA